MNSPTNAVTKTGNGGMVHQPGVVAREEFGATQVELRSETAASGVAARERAMVEAMYVMALQRPRNMEMVRIKLLSECDRAGFCEVARYRKPVGKEYNEANGKWEQKYADGFSIRFAEAAKRCLGNIFDNETISFENPTQRIVRRVIIDLENNNTVAGEQMLSKTVERKSLKKGQEAISQRQNSLGATTYLVNATDDETGMKQASGWSKFMRQVLRFVPGDILDECESRILRTLEKGDKEDPGAARRLLIDSFVKVGVTPVDLQSYLGHSLDILQPKELAELRATYTALREGDVKWADVMEARQPEGSREAASSVAETKKAELRKDPAPPEDTPHHEQSAASGEPPVQTDAPQSDEGTGNLFKVPKKK